MSEVTVRELRNRGGEVLDRVSRGDAAAARGFGRVVASLHRSVHKTVARAYDALIAATALAKALPLYTCNPDDFAGIEELEVVPAPVR